VFNTDVIIAAVQYQGCTEPVVGHAVPLSTAKIMQCQTRVTVWSSLRGLWHPHVQTCSFPSLSWECSLSLSSPRVKEALYAFFWVIPRRLNFICRRFGTLCSIFIGR
jgi:hypothetical protein